MIEFKNVSKKYNNNVIGLDHVSLHIEPGEFVFLIGPSGAGKSSLVNLLMKHIQPDSGQIFFNGENITHLPARRVPKLRQRIGVVFQEFRLLEDMTVYENIDYCLSLLGMSRKDKKKRVREVLELVHLQDRMKSYPNQLSGGEQQRISIARAMATKPEIIIADEPTGNLDPATSWEVMRSFESINANGTTVIVSTHASEIVDTMKKRVLQLSHGQLVRDEEGGRYMTDFVPFDPKEADDIGLFDPTTSFPREELQRRLAEEERKRQQAKDVRRDGDAEEDVQ